LLSLHELRLNEWVQLRVGGAGLSVLSGVEKDVGAGVRHVLQAGAEDRGELRLACGLINDMKTVAL